jgi:uncharacterized protein YjbJ (UPF0337 family)
MNDVRWLQINTQWLDFTGRIRDRWGEITDAELAEIGGNHDKLIQLLQERYDLSRDEAETQVSEWVGQVFD